MEQKDLLNMYFKSIDTQRQLLAQLQDAMRHLAIAERKLGEVFDGPSVRTELSDL